MDPSKIGAMSCNPAIGGLAKGQIVREIDALGGLMGLATDATGIQFRMLNMSKGPAVRGPRAQCDKYAYAAEVQRLISTRPNLDVIAATVDELMVENERIVGVRVPASAVIALPDQDAIEWNIRNEGLARPLYASAAPATKGESWEGGSARAITQHSTQSLTPSLEGRGSITLLASAVVLTTGTFMRGLMHTGERKREGGRIGEGSAVGISGMLRDLGFDLGRLKTGTPPRLARESIEFAALRAQHGDEAPVPFSDLTPAALPLRRFPNLPQVSCYETSTSKEAHDLIRANLHRAPMYCGAIEAECGPRYCPSIEDKVVKFADRESHHVFLEPESLHTNEIYCNGISTSLPEDVQERIVHTMPGCEGAVILKWGYAVEYDMVWPHQIDATGMTKRVRGLFLAGQINGTSGYEEAAGQGLVAGMNAARLARGFDLVRFGRDQAYIGVMMDDLVTKTPREPYRMFTSRAEYRLLLRSDNADERLTPLGRELGLVDDLRWTIFEKRHEQLRALRHALATSRHEGKPLAEFAKRAEVTAAQIAAKLNGAMAELPEINSQVSRLDLLERVMIDIQYEGYIARQRAEVRRMRDAENMRIPSALAVDSIAGLRSESRDALRRFRPATLGQAGRLAGVHTSDIALLALAIRKLKASETAIALKS
jgi:tRNA uridine 5-carboxymethylaminomethyl modification enzyme